MQSYLLRSFLMVTSLAARSLHSTPSELILNWSRAKKNNFVEWNVEYKLYSDFWSFGSPLFHISGGRSDLDFDPQIRHIGSNKLPYVTYTTKRVLSHLF